MRAYVGVLLVAWLVGGCSSNAPSSSANEQASTEGDSLPVLGGADADAWLGTFDTDERYDFARIVLLPEGRALTCTARDAGCTPWGLPAGADGAPYPVRRFTLRGDDKRVYVDLDEITTPAMRFDRAVLRIDKGAADAFAITDVATHRRVAFTRAPCSELMYREDDADAACAFYECKAARQACSYYTDFGLKYCKRYYAVSFDDHDFGPHARQCLQEALRDATRTTQKCDDIEALALASHEGCYVDSGYCELDFVDRDRIVHEVDLEDRTFDNGLRLLSTKIKCLETP